MHVAYINKHGLEKYYQTMGIEPEEEHNSYEDNSKNLNLGLINIEQKSETDVENINTGLTVREWVEIAVLLIIAIGILRVIYKFCMQRRKKSQIKKKKTLKEVMQSVTAPNQEMLIKMVTQVPAKEFNTVPQQENNEKQLVPYIQERPMPVSVDVSRLPLFPSSYYS